MRVATRPVEANWVPQMTLTVLLENFPFVKVMMKAVTTVVLCQGATVASSHGNKIL